MVAVADVARGAACNCVCPGCDQPVIARQGTEREWHFAHVKGDACAAGYEKSVHEFAKQILCGTPTLVVPGLTATRNGLDAYGRGRVASKPVAEARIVRFERCIQGESAGDVTPDVIAVGANTLLHIEIVVFHRLGEDKRDRLVRSGVPCVEIDLSAFRTQQVTRERLEEALFRNESNRRWVFHPDYDRALEGAKEQLEQLLLAAQTQWNAEAVTRNAQEIGSKPKTLAATPQVGMSASATGERIWRASLPVASVVEAAARNLADSHRIPVGDVMCLIAKIQRRGDLARVTPDELSVDWAMRLGIPETEVGRFLREAGYVL